jgi:hypothetical protein
MIKSKEKEHVTKIGKGKDRPLIRDVEMKTWRSEGERRNKKQNALFIRKDDQYNG